MKKMATKTQLMKPAKSHSQVKLPMCMANDSLKKMQKLQSEIRKLKSSYLGKIAKSIVSKNKGEKMIGLEDYN